MSKETGIAIFRLAGKGFHKDLHRLCSVVDGIDRRFDGERWHIEHAREYAEKFAEWWPEFAQRVDDFEKQLELQL